MYTLYYAPGSAAMAPHAALEEIGAPYRLVAVDLTRPRDPAYLALNPDGWVPVLIDENGVMHESAAIVLYLADRHPEAALAPATDDRLRGAYLQWLLYMAGVLQIAYQLHYYPERHSAGPAAAVQAKAAERLARAWGRLDGVLAAAGPYLLGERFSACDLYLHMLAGWHPEPERLARECPAVTACAERVAARPAVRRVLAAHGVA